MNELTHSHTQNRVFGATAFSIASHVFGNLTCASCWAIFAPALASLFGSGGTAFLSALRPYAPLTLLVSAAGLTYSIYQLLSKRQQSKQLGYRLAAAFTGFSVVSWGVSAGYIAATFRLG